MNTRPPASDAERRARRMAALIVRAPRELHAANAATAKRHLGRRVLAGWGAVVLDCGRVDTVDSTAVGALIQVARLARREGCQFALANIRNEDVRQFLLQTLLADLLFAIYDDVPADDVVIDS